MIGRGAALVRAHLGEAQFFQINGMDEGVHDAYHVVRGDHLVQRGGEEPELLAVLSGTMGHRLFSSGLVCGYKIIKSRNVSKENEDFFTV